MRVPPAYEAAFKRWGYLADAEAHKYGLPNGATLLAKVGYVETRYSKDLTITSSAGARGPMQFMPETRAAYIKQYGVDPWASIDQAVHAAAIFMKTSGLAGYNPGSGSYIGEVTGAPVAIGAEGAAAPRPRSGKTTAKQGRPADDHTVSGAPMVKFLLTGAFLLGGASLVGLGLTRAAGANPEGQASREVG